MFIIGSCIMLGTLGLAMKFAHIVMTMADENTPNNGIVQL